MTLFFNKLLSSIPAIAPPKQNRNSAIYSTGMQGPDRDVFERSTVSPAFTSRKRSPNHRTSAGNCLKDLDNITCPYSGVKMITSKKMDALEAKLAGCRNISERLELLEPYKKCMQPLEKNMYQVFKSYELNNPAGTMQDCLEKLKPDCLAELKIEQLQVIDAIDSISNKADARTALKIREVTTEARKKIIEDNQDQIFKRKNILSELYEATKDYPDKNLLSEMWQTANILPKSTTNINAFVVKYSSRSSQEIAARLLRPSVCSIEHIDPASVTGENSLTNFMLASNTWNSDRSSTPLPEYIKEHPGIPEFSQKYMNDIIKAIHKSKLKDCDWYPYVLKEKLFYHSDGLINLDTSKYMKTEEAAFAGASENVKQIYEDLKDKNTAITEK